MSGVSKNCSWGKMSFIIERCPHLRSALVLREGFYCITIIND